MAHPESYETGIVKLLVTEPPWVNGCMTQSALIAINPEYCYLQVNWVR